MKIPLSLPFFDTEEKQAVLDVLTSGMLAQGKYVDQLEKDFCRVTGAREAIAVSSGTAALHIALLAHGIGPGDEVITTPFTFIATVNAILLTGARPVFVDIDEQTMNIDAARIPAAITPRTKAILPVHLFGHPVDIAAIEKIAGERKLLVIDDAAQAIGSRLADRPIGSERTCCFSLYATKNVAAGEGGIVTTDDPLIADRCRLLRNHGMRRRYFHEMLGFNYRMTDLCAAIACVQLSRLDAFQAARTRHAQMYSERLIKGIRPEVHPGVTHAWHQYTIRFPGTGAVVRDAVAEHLKQHGIGTGIFYPLPAHKQEHLIARGYESVSLPVAERIANEVLSIPVHPQLTSEDVSTVISVINSCDA